MSSSEKIPCIKCGVKILSYTAKTNGGHCVPCLTGTRESVEQRKIELAHARETPAEPDFVCLECGSKQWRSEIHVNTLKNIDDPWSMTASRIECWDCGVIMPRPLAHRWNDVSLEEAKNMGRKVSKR